MRISIVVLALLAVPAAAVPAWQCPFDVPIVTIAPHEVAGFKWGSVIRPFGDACLSHIRVEPGDSSAWYVGGENGVYVTRNNGETWIKPLTGQVGALLLARDGTTNLVYAGVEKNLYRSTNGGLTWTNIKTFATRIRSLLVFKNKLYVGLAWSSHASGSGVWSGNLDGTSMIFKPFGSGHTGLIVWTLSAHAASGAIYAGTEIFDHPLPYKPPFFRSLNGGWSWTNVAGTLSHHAADSEVRPSDGFLYVLLEGQGTYGSSDQGKTWIAPTVNPPGLGVELLMDVQSPLRLYAGRHKTNTLEGGLFLSTNGGKTYSLIGLKGATVSDMALNHARTRIYATAYGSGIYVGRIP